MTERHESGGDASHRVAVIGMAGRFPGAATVDEFWDNLVNGVDSISRFPGADGDFTPAWGVLDGADEFDAAFFGCSPRDALILDPQHRVFLECAWEALEDAGYDPAAHPGDIGVYAGGGSTAYLSVLRSRSRELPGVTDLQLRLGNGVDLLATRVCYKLGLRGPGMSIQSGCSSSLVAIHVATQAVLAGECDMALAGGATVHLPIKTGTHADAGLLAPDGRLRPFDAAASGTVFANAVGIVVLKRLDEATSDGDNVRAVICGSAVGNDGCDKIGLVAPSVEGQARTVRAAHHVSQIDPGTITYLEAHGTGTRLGDPIEVAGLARAFRQASGRRHPCRIGSVKANVGHADAAAGVVGFIKTVLALERAQVPGTLHFERPSPLIAFDDGPFVVNAELADWRPPEGIPRRAGVNSLGFGGTNAHVVLEEAPAPPSRGPAVPWQLLPVSAKGPESLASAMTRLIEHLERRPRIPLADVAWTLQVGRRAQPYRRFAVCARPEDVRAALSGSSVPRAAGEAGGPPPGVVLTFPATSDLGASLELYRHLPTFREQVDRCAELLARALGLDLREALSAERADPVAAHAATFAVEYALAVQLQRLGVEPIAVAGAGAGALAAACVAGAVALSDAATTAATWGRQPSGRSADAGALLRCLSDTTAPPTDPLQVATSACWAAHLRRRDGGGVGDAGPDRFLLDLGAASGLRPLLEVLGELWQRNVPIAWPELHRDERCRRVPLPAYPFQRERYLMEPLDGAQSVVTGAGLPASELAPPQDVEAAVTDLFAIALGTSPSSVDDDFYDLGGDSVVAMQLAGMIAEEFQIRLDAQAVMEHSTIARLAERIRSAGRRPDA